MNVLVFGAPRGAAHLAGLGVDTKHEIPTVRRQPTVVTSQGPQKRRQRRIIQIQEVQMHLDRKLVSSHALRR
jgi:hypothetical protein